MALLEQAVPVPPRTTGRTVAVPFDADERAARRSLRHQIAKLERDLAASFVAARGHVDESSVPLGREHGPRVLSLAELEALRDRLAERLRHVRAELGERADVHEDKRLLIEQMLLEPGKHQWVRVTGADIGEHVCKSWHVRPRMGIIGMLAGWWHVKISSGCPLATGVPCA